MRITSKNSPDPYDDVSEIHTNFPDKKYKKLLSLCKLTENSEIGPHQAAQILVNATHHFLLGHLSQDVLSAIANSLWADLSNDDKTTEVGNALYAAAEMSFYIRRIYSKKGNHGGFENWMIEVMQFYDKNRQLVVKGNEF